MSLHLLDRLVDGTIASVVMRAVSSNMLPSQTAMSMFKEPQRAVTAIQGFLDGTKATCSLLADLSKAFERVNPYWILALLRQVCSGRPSQQAGLCRHQCFSVVSQATAKIRPRPAQGLFSIETNS